MSETESIFEWVKERIGEVFQGRAGHKVAEEFEQAVGDDSRIALAEMLKRLSQRLMRWGRSPPSPN